MDLSLAPATNSDQEQDRDKELNSNIGASSTSGTGNDSNFPMMMTIPQPEKEHMFDKVVTPSDVGKLNRLVIPKQHAERYFPLDSSNNQNGTLLNFQDRNGKMWRFRYSYWNSSQSYAGVYFNKIQCFCFEEQRLLPGEQIDMPVFFYTDSRMDGINNLILSYTFFKVSEETTTTDSVDNKSSVPVQETN
ncbi:hypothetical protein F2Q70_00006959 [Brassica cretica]|uniref:TF-B3 domain-containing protein n=1 Tax=Brassica cretica TaxID=69181 RepID=A0A8S9MDF6_BRACR|nr:hypothetical protein F2Q70_00006959 [Brassica cretica]